MHRCVRGSKDDVVFFTGSGCTGAMRLLLHLLQLPRRIEAWHTAHPHPKSGEGAAVVLLGPFEHHSNLLPWRETGATIVSIKTVCILSPSSARCFLLPFVLCFDGLQKQSNEHYHSFG